MSELLASPFFGIALSILAFWVGVRIQKKTGLVVCNPLLIGIVLVVGVLLLFRIPYESYHQGGEIINMFLAPATACLAVAIYGKIRILKENWLPILVGCVVGSASSMGSILLLCRLFGLDAAMTASLLPKSVTTPIAISVSQAHGGIGPITVVAVLITGIFGSIAAPLLIKLFRVKDPMTAGLAIGASSHAVGTSKALELGHRVIVVVNKIDRPDQRIHEVIDEVLELLMDLNATPEQLDSPMLFCSGRQGTASYSPDVVGTDLTPLFETILEYIPAPEADVDQPFQMLVSSIDYNEFVGRIAVGRIERGTLKQNQEIVVCNYHDPDAAPKKAKAVSIYEFEGLARKQVTESTAGNIIAMSGIPDITIGDTVCAPGAVEPLPFVKISAPTLEMTFSVNDSPYAGREGKFVTSRQLRDRLYRETLKDVSLKVSDTDRDSAFNVAGRGEMSLSDRKSTRLNSSHT